MLSIYRKILRLLGFFLISVSAMMCLSAQETSAFGKAAGETKKVKKFVTSTDKETRKKQLEEKFLHAVKSGNTEEAKACLKAGVPADFPFSTPQRQFFTPLSLAVEKGFLEMTDLLMDYGADPNLPASNGVSPLVAAILYDRPEIIKLLCEYGANVNLVNRYKRSPLDDAMARDLFKCGTVLRSYGAECYSIIPEAVENSAIWAPILAMRQTQKPRKTPKWGGGCI